MAREKWLSEAVDTKERAKREASDFLRHVDHAGRYADFHALRHSFITNLARTGAHFKTTQDLARHSTPNLTARYAHGFKDDEVAAVNSLPSLAPSAVITTSATGTDGRNRDRPTDGSRPRPSPENSSLYSSSEGAFVCSTVQTECKNSSPQRRNPIQASRISSAEFDSSKGGDNDKEYAEKTPRWGARVVEWTGLENRRGACRHRGFESHPHRFRSPVNFAQGRWGRRE